MSQLLSSGVRNGLCCLFAFAATAFPASMASQAAKPDVLAGVWRAEVRSSRPIQGELTVDARGGSWRASIAGYQFAIQANEEKFDFHVPGNGGEFRGHLDRKDDSIYGEWVQPQTPIIDRQYASPVKLHRIAPSVWRGTVVPLDLSLSVYAEITVSADGKLKGVFNNPEANFFRSHVFVVTHQGANVHLNSNGWKFDGTYDEKSDSFSFQFADFLPAFQFTRLKEGEAVGLYPRARNDGPWQYLEPIREDDGWQTASLQSEGMRPEPIAALLHQILSADPAANPNTIQSLLIARHGHLILEEYFYGFDRERTHDMRSAAKTFAPVLVGLAKEHGASLSPETPVYPLFSQYTSFANPDPRKEKMSLRDIMTMTAGNACDDNDDNSPGNEDRMQGDAHITDWYKYTLDLPMVKPPGGEDAIYCSADLNLVGGAVAAATHSWLPEFFEENLARPLQFGHYYLNLMPDGQAYMGGGAYLRPRDQLKLGQLYLAGGVWNGKRIVSRSWVQESTAFHSRFAPEFSLGQRHEYGYGWHINYLKSGGKTYRAFSAGGNGGQLVIVVPELDLVVGITGGNYGEFNKWYRWEFEIVPQFILAAAIP